MQRMMVTLALILYTAFSFNPVAEISIFSRTLNLSPGDLVTMFIAFGIMIKSFLTNGKVNLGMKHNTMRTFFLTYIFLALVFLLPTLLFFLMHNELADYLPRSLYIYLLWSVAFVLFYAGSSACFKIEDIKLVAKILMASFIVGVLSNIFFAVPGANLTAALTDIFASPNTRLGGQISDPNQLGTVAAFFSIVGIVAVINEKKFGSRIFFTLLTIGTSAILLLTQSRESLLTIFIACFFVGVLLFRRKQHAQAMLLFFGMALGATLAIISVPRINETIQALDVGDSGAALSSRDQVWQAAVEIIMRYPLGIGFENLYYLTDNTIGQAHNAFLQSAIIAGILGFCVFSSFWIFLFKLLRDRMDGGTMGSWIFDAYFVFCIGYLVTSMGSDHFISFFTFNAIFFGFLGVVVGAH